MTSRIIALSLVLLGSIQTGLAQASATSMNGPTLILASTPEPHLFRVELHNPGSHDLVLDLGMALANGAKQYPNAIEFALTTSDGRILHLVPINDLAMIGGRVDPLICAVPPSGATFSFLVNLEKYFPPQAKDWKLHLFAWLPHAAGGVHRSNDSDDRSQPRRERYRTHALLGRKSCFHSSCVHFDLGL